MKVMDRQMQVESDINNIGSSATVETRGMISGLRLTSSY